MLIVQKFGGSSLADLERLRRAAEKALEARRKGHDTVVVVSAMGDSTDNLSDIAHRIHPTPPARELDALLGSGEQQSAALMAMMLCSLGQPSCSLSGPQAGIYADMNHGDARVLGVYPRRIQEALEQGMVPVVCGFQAINEAGDLCTLGRGGSDTTAVALAAELRADSCLIYTDVDGIYTADPRLVKGARRLSAIDYRDMLRLACSGSQVLHCRSVELAMDRDVELRLLSSFEVGEGTAVKALPHSERPDIAGVTRDAEQGTVSVVGKGADDKLRAQLVYLLSAQPTEAEEGCISLRMDKEQLPAALQRVHDFLFCE